MNLFGALACLIPAVAHADIASDINADVNRAVRYVPDREDVWRVADRYGDCEDIALRKIVELARHGIRALIGVYHDPEYDQAHAVAIVGDRILDGRRPAHHARTEIRWKGTEKWIWIGEMRNGGVYVTKLGNQPVTWQWKIRSIAR